MKYEEVLDAFETKGFPADKIAKLKRDFQRCLKESCELLLAEFERLSIARNLPDNADLLPCPFCGSKDLEMTEYKREFFEDDEGFNLSCNTCCSSGPSQRIDAQNIPWFKTADLAKAAWNTRYVPEVNS